MSRPEAPAVAELIRRHYEGCGAGSGGCLHVQLDDGNLDDTFFDHEDRERVEACGCRTGLAAFDALVQMRKTARRKARWLAFYG